MAVVRAVFEAAARRDRSSVLALCDPEVELDLGGAGIGGLLEQPVYRGTLG